MEQGIQEVLYFVKIAGVAIGLLLATFILTRFLFFRLYQKLLAVLIGKWPVYVSSRYFFSKRNKNVINIIAGISIFGITVCTAALILVLSVFNGFEVLISDLYSAFDPDLKVVPAEGKSLVMNDTLMDKITAHPEVTLATPSIENKAVIQYYGRQHFIILKGVNPEYNEINPVKEYVYSGDYAFQTAGGTPTAVLGGSVAWYINANLNDRVHPMQIKTITDLSRAILDPTSAVKTINLFPAGYFQVQKEYDERYVLVSYETAEKLFEMDGRASAIEVGLKDFLKADEVKEELEAKLGPRYEVLTWYEQHQTLYQVMKNEKLVAYLVLTLMLVISGINIIGSLSMIVLEKTRDVAVLRAIGSPGSGIKKIFLSMGLLMGGLGGIMGMLVAYGFGFIQVQTGLVEMSGGETFIVSAFPVEMRLLDFLLIFVTVFTLSVLASLYPASRASRQIITENLNR